MKTENATIEIESLLSWGEPKQVNTKRGARTLRTATPTPTFWGEWRRNQSALRDAGVSPSKGRDGWEVCWWQSIYEPAVAETVQPSDAGNASDAGSIHLSEQGRKTEGGPRLESRKTTLPAGAPDKSAMVRRENETKAGEETTPTASSPTSLSERVWSSEQQAIFAWFKSGKGNLVVQARAGTGKTTTIKEAFAHAPEQQMLYAVFNKKNQREALGKISDPRVEVKTLHSLGYSYILSVWPGSKPDDAVEGDRIRAACPGVPDEAVNAIERLVGFGKNLFVALPSVGELVQTALDRGVFCGVQDQLTGADEFPTARLAEIARKAMELSLTQDTAKRVSFSDMVWLPVAAGWVRPCYDLVVVDEAQDMNLPQLLMARRSVRNGGRVCIVGDNRQAIYGFRGAAQDGMDMMQRELNAQVLGLTTTYRCPKLVVEKAAAIVPDYKAAPSAPEGEIAFCLEGDLFQKLAVGDAVLSRANAPLMPLCLGLLRKGVPVRIEGRDIGKQLVGMVRKLKAKSVPDFLRKLEHWSDKQKSRLNVGKLGPAKCAVIDDQRDTLAALAEGCANVSEIEARINALFQDTDENSRPAVVLSTVHKAKGLEWERVSLLGWTFNKSRSGMTPEQRQEESNIYYVAMTRSKRALTMVSEGGRKVEEQKDGTQAGAM